MKFERNAKILRGPLNAAPVAGVIMLLLIFIMISSLLYTPGVVIQLPVANPLAVTDNPTVVVAVDSNGQCFYDNKPVDPEELRAALKSRLHDAALQSKKLTLVLWADKSVKNEVIMKLETLAQAAGITEVLIAGNPPAFGPQQ
jgi:biopolymer transport protein ExbD